MVHEVAHTNESTANNAEAQARPTNLTRPIRYPILGCIRAANGEIVTPSLLFSTDNLVEALLIQFLYPNDITHFTELDFEALRSNHPTIQFHAEEIRNHLRKEEVRNRGFIERRAFIVSNVRAIDAYIKSITHASNETDAAAELSRLYPKPVSRPHDVVPAAEQPGSPLPIQTLPPTLSPEYPGGYVRIPIASGITFSTGNLAQALFLQIIYPHLRFRSPFTDRAFMELWGRDEHKYNRMRELAGLIRNQLQYSDTDKAQLQEIMCSAYQSITSKLPKSSIHENNDPTETAIAKELIRIYFERLELTLADIQRVITESGINLDEFDEARINRILHTTIRRKPSSNPIAVLTLLPDPNIIAIAVEQCRNQNSWGSYLLSAVKNMWNQVAEFFASLVRRQPVNFFSRHNIQYQEVPTNGQAYAAAAAAAISPRPKPISYPFARTNNNDDYDAPALTRTPAPRPNQSNRSLPHLKNYQEVVSRTLDQYINRFKFSIFGHHHEARARAVKIAIQQSASIENIYTILKRQEIILRDVRERQATMTSQELQEYACIPDNLTWRNPSERLRWNGFFEVANYTPPAESGYYQVIQEALAIDPYDASLPLRSRLT